MNSGQPNPSQPGSNEPEFQDHDSIANGDARSEMLESLLNQTRHALDNDGYHTLLTNYVREQRLSSKFDFDNLSELVRCIVGRTQLDQLPVDKEDAVAWIANCFYEDPVARERVESLWNSIVSRMQKND